MLLLLIQLLKHIDWLTCFPLRATARDAHPRASSRSSAARRKPALLSEVLRDVFFNTTSMLAPHGFCAILYSKPAVHKTEQKNMYRIYIKSYLHALAPHQAEPQQFLSNSRTAVPRCIHETTLSPQDQLNELRLASEAQANTLEEKETALVLAQV